MSGIAYNEIFSLSPMHILYLFTTGVFEKTQICF